MGVHSLADQCIQCVVNHISDTDNNLLNFNQVPLEILLVCCHIHHHHHRHHYCHLLCHLLCHILLLLLLLLLLILLLLPLILILFISIINHHHHYHPFRSQLHHLLYWLNILQEILYHIRTDRNLKRRDEAFLANYWSIALKKLFSSCPTAITHLDFRYISSFLYFSGALLLFSFSSDASLLFLFISLLSLFFSKVIPRSLPLHYK